MPPRPARRSTRFSSREPDQSPAHDSPNALVRPQLPPLQGTPSARRQYTYGSAAEPPPRVGAGLQRMDLSNAVNQALSKRDDEEEEFVRPTRPRSGLTTRAEEDAASRDNAPQPATGAPRQLVAGSDADSSRSFGLESDYYEDATIGSAPTLTPAAEKRQVASRLSSRTQQDTSDQRDSQPARRDLLSAATQPSKGRASQQTGSGTTRQTRLRSQDLDEDEPETRTARVTRSKSVNTPAPNRTQQNPSYLQPRKPAVVEDSQEDDSSEHHDSESEQEAHSNARATKHSINPRPRVGSQEPSQNSFPRRRTTQSTTRDKGLFARANEINAQRTSFNRAHEIPDDPRERDLAIQREIQEAEDQLARERAERESQTQAQFQGGTWQHWLMQRFAWLSSRWPFNLIGRRRQVDDFDDFDDDEVNNGGPTEWWRLLNPMTYLDTIVWFVDTIVDYIINTLGRLSGIQLSVQSSWTAWLLRGAVLTIFALAFGGSFFSAVVSSLRPSVPDFPDMGSMPSGSFHWPNPAGFVSKVGNIIPSISWPSWGKDDETDIWDKLDNVAFPDDHKKALDALKENAELHSKALKRLKSKLPRVVHMDLVDGRPVIKQEFWHALQDLLKEDGSFLNLDKKNGDYEVSSDKQWRAIVSRLDKDPSFTLKLNNSVKEIENRVENKLPSFWDTWIRNNNDFLEPLVDKAMAKRQTAGSGADFDQQLSKIVNEQLKQHNQTAVSRDDFLGHLKSDLAKHRSEIQAEFAQLRSEMEAHIQESIRTATNLAPQGVSDEEIKKLVKGIVYQTLTDGSLEATAKSKIHVHWDSVLKHQVNFFGIGSGAAIDPTLTTPPWDPWGKGVATDEAYKSGILGLHPPPPIAALHPWQDEGDRFCTSSLTVDSSGNPHHARLSVLLGHLVIPKDIAIEHILPGATTDPDARPKHIEVWARFDDDEDRERVRDVSARDYPDNTDAWDFPSAKLPSSFVKISQFVYEGAGLHDGVHVHHISNEFSTIGAATDQIVIRAVSNYGAKDHTCFYRVRVFGERVG
ncbi:hypothetical protein FSARC_11467 [Fusarium sarcochroum]|uniref:SUN domain-containing protein n=1 Tax=Fusarium sarcochroum TaxID=1208366 RepID=A0A8H4X0I9_9HYPO|nr:hypothetical protein FSARC_11467 [Fusarium sarcochroum]